MSIHAAALAALDLLKAGMSPLLTAAQVGLRAPGDEGEQFPLGVFLHSIGRDSRFSMSARLRPDAELSHSPPLCLELLLMVTSYIGKKSGPADDYRLLERVAQVWRDGEVPISTPLQPAAVPPPRLELLSPDPDAISKLWQFPGTPYRPSLFFRLAPVAVQMGGAARAEPVRGVGYQAGDRREGGG